MLSVRWPTNQQGLTVCNMFQWRQFFITSPSSTYNTQKKTGFSNNCTSLVSLEWTFIATGIMTMCLDFVPIRIVVHCNAPRHLLHANWFINSSGFTSTFRTLGIQIVNKEPMTLWRFHAYVHGKLNRRK